MRNDRDLPGEIRALISERLLVEVESIDIDLLQEGILDSVSLVQLILHLEEHFGVKIDLHELEIEDLRSVRSISHLVAARASFCAKATGPSRPVSGLRVANGA